MTCARAQAGVDLAHAGLLGSFTEGHETERFGIQIRISPQNIKDNARGWAIVTRTNNHSIAKNEELLSFVVILHLSKGVDDLAQGSVTFSVTRHLTDDELVMVFRSTSGSKIDGGEEFEANDRHHDDEEDQEGIGDRPLSR